MKAVEEMTPRRFEQIKDYYLPYKWNIFLGTIFVVDGRNTTTAIIGRRWQRRRISHPKLREAMEVMTVGGEEGVMRLSGVSSRWREVDWHATPYASGFDHFYIADEVQFKFDRCLRFLQDRVQDLPVFGIGHSLGSVIHLLIGSRYAVKKNGNVLMAFNNKDASLAVPFFSSVLAPMMQNIGPVLSDIASSPTIRLGAEMTMKQIENLSPSIVKQVFPLVEQLPPLYMDLIKGKDNFTPRPEETQRLIRSYYGISRNLLIKFKDDTIDETSTLAQVLSSGSAISSMLDMSIRSLPGDHALPLQQALPDVPPGMTDAVNRSGELLANLTAGTPWESVAKEVGNTLGNVDSILLSSGNSKDLDLLVETITSWMLSNSSPRLLQ